MRTNIKYELDNKINIKIKYKNSLDPSLRIDKQGLRFFLLLATSNQS